MMDNRTMRAPVAPGIPARWRSSAKEGIEKSLNASSNVTFTLSCGILNEIYFPHEDIASTRDMEFVVTDGLDFFSEGKRHTNHETTMLDKGIPACRIMNGCKTGHYVIEKEIIVDPIRNVVLQQVCFPPLKGKVSDYQLFALLASHLGDLGDNNTAWVGDYRGIPLLCAMEDIPERGLYFGKPSGSIMPLVWAQSEYMKLCTSLKLRKIFGISEYARFCYHFPSSSGAPYLAV